MKLPGVTAPDTRGWLALASVAMVMWGLGLLAFVRVPDTNRDLFNLLVAQAVVVGFVNVFAYYFGSSKGATDVRAQLGQALNKLPNADPAAAPPPPEGS